MATHLLRPIKLAIWIVGLSALMSSCIERVPYRHAYDVDQGEWKPSDTLTFGFCVSDSIAKWDYNTLSPNRPYRMSLILRYAESYEYVTVPLHVRIDTLSSYLVKPRLSRPSTWGWQKQEEFDVSGILVSLADTGLHHIMVYPDTVLTGISAVGIELTDKVNHNRQ